MTEWGSSHLHAFLPGSTPDPSWCYHYIVPGPPLFLGHLWPHISAFSQALNLCCDPWPTGFSLSPSNQSLQRMWAFILKMAKLFLNHWVSGKRERSVVQPSAPGVQRDRALFLDGTFKCTWILTDAQGSASRLLCHCISFPCILF